MKRTGASLAVHALEQIGVRFTFGIPGVHNTELYDELSQSRQIEPILVTHELSAAFMADAVSRTGDSIGTLLLVPAAGTTHAMSGIGEAFLDGIPMLVITGGTRRDSGRHYQLHQIDQKRLVETLTKKAIVVTDQSSIPPAIYEAYEAAISGTPGPVLVEIPTELQLFRTEVRQLEPFSSSLTPPAPDPAGIAEAARLLREARRPGLYLGWGARRCSQGAVELAELLGAPVSTTLQGLSVFPADHPLHTGMGFGVSSVPAAEKAFQACDCLLAVGARFSELATGSYSLPVPRGLIHVDINREVFNKNYPAQVSIEGDAGEVVQLLLDALKSDSCKSRRNQQRLRQLVRAEKESYLRQWTRRRNAERVSPGHFFTALRRKLDDDAYLAVDDGNHTFLTAELFPVYRSRHFISPTDYNAMGYCVPAAIGIKLSHPDHQVVGIAGDGAFLMTGLEMMTASRLNLGIVYCVFNDGELGQIAQLQKIPLNRKTCTVMGRIELQGIAQATGAAYLAMGNDGEIEPVLDQALAAAQTDQPVIVDVKIDYSRKTRFTRGVVKTNLGRFSWKEKARFIGRAAKRHILG
ncbi:MAG: thiamine pyrophosphate-binding protein [Acidobacteriota bacterium]